jgi:hypothetical protein
MILGRTGKTIELRERFVGAKASEERSTQAPMWRHGTSEVTPYGVAPSAEGRRGSASGREGFDRAAKSARAKRPSRAAPNERG